MSNSATLRTAPTSPTRRTRPVHDLRVPRSRAASAPGSGCCEPRSSYSPTRGCPGSRLKPSPTAPAPASHRLPALAVAVHLAGRRHGPGLPTIPRRDLVHLNWTVVDGPDRAGFPAQALLSDQPFPRLMAAVMDATERDPGLPKHD